MDQNLRDLEHRVATGDAEAKARLAAQRCRIGQHCWHLSPGQGFVSLFQARFVCCNCGGNGYMTSESCPQEEASCGPHAPTIEQGNWVFGPAEPDKPFQAVKWWRFGWRIAD